MPSTGDKYDYFGETWEVLSISKDKRYARMVCNDSRDAFGRVYPRYATMHVSAFNVMRKLVPA
ncbi:MAG TPA: hypothetical protein VGP72_05270 [Planctomycetota bacterium]|jgi:hypothetical protein